jgi:hypothetical protein
MVDFVGVRPKGGVPRIIAANPADLEVLERLRPGRPFAVKAVFKRSVPHHRFYWGLVGIVADALGMSSATLHAQLKFEAELVDRILSSQAFGVAVQLKSIAFDKMDEGDFTAYRQRAVDLIFTRYLPGIARKDVFKRVEEMCGPCPW